MNLPPIITLRRKVYEGWICLFLYFEPDDDLSSMANALSAEWSETYCAWYLVEHSYSIHELVTVYLGNALLDISDLEPYERLGAPPFPTLDGLIISHEEKSIEDINYEKEYALNHFHRYLKSQGYASGTLRNYKYQVKRFLFSCNLSLKDITEREIKKYRDKLKGQGFDSCAKSFARGAKIFFWLREQKILDVHEREFHRKELKKKYWFISHEVLTALCGYKAWVGVN